MVSVRVTELLKDKIKPHERQPTESEDDYVSRVARGERTSDAVARALDAEIRRVLALSRRQLDQQSLATAHRALVRPDSGT